MTRAVRTRAPSRAAAAFRDGTAFRGVAAFRGVMVAILLAACAAPPAPAATVHLVAERRGDAIDIRASAALNADAATAWRVLTDYERYPRFIPDLDTSRIVARRGPVVTVEQSGHAWLWWLRIPVDVIYEITESPPTGLHARAIAGSVRALESHYRLTPVPAGVTLDYAGRVSPGFERFEQLERYAVARAAQRQFQALADEIERSAASSAATPPVAR